MKLHAIRRDWPITSPGKPGIDPPRISSPGAECSIVYQTSGIVEVMCGSPASSGVPVAERSPDTAQLFEPDGSSVSPIAARTSAICSASSSGSPDHGTPGSVTTGLPPGYCGSSSAVRSAPMCFTSSAR